MAATNKEEAHTRKFAAAPSLILSFFLFLAFLCTHHHTAHKHQNTQTQSRHRLAQATKAAAAAAVVPLFSLLITVRHQQQEQQQQQLWQLSECTRQAECVT